MTTPREATPAEAAAVRASEARRFGYSINPCQSIPPRHAPYTAGDGHTYCTRCGEVISERPRHDNGADSYAGSVGNQ